MTPTVTFVRHAQGYHNLNTAAHDIRDPLLTPYGFQQCTLLATSFPRDQTPELIVASPLKRTIYTALNSFPATLKDRHLTIVTIPELQETSDMPCDTGSSRAVLEKEFYGKPVSFGLVEDGWESKQGKWAPVWSAIEERARLARRWLRSRPEKHIVAVTHGGFLHHLTGDWTDSNKFAGTGWANTEYRTYTFDATSEHDAKLIETEESQTRRRGLEKPLSEAERRNLSRAADAEEESHDTESMSANAHSQQRQRDEGLKLQAKV